ncbi:hypothetical protein L6R50_04790 [Myxococcota bacterium]|nr:hypothetical protein [Myxococcota bacterium]
MDVYANADLDVGVPVDAPASVDLDVGVPVDVSANVAAGGTTSPAARPRHPRPPPAPPC